MKHLIFFSLFLLSQEVLAQCDSYLTIETLIKIKNDLDEAQDLLIDCFTLDTDEEIDYGVDGKGRYVSFVSNKKIDFGKCTVQRERVNLYYRTPGVGYTVRSSSHYLAIKNAVKKSGKKLPHTTNGYDSTYSYRGLEWNFQVQIDKECAANHYNISIYNLN